MLIERPWLIPFGGGFNNYQQVSDGPSAHNIYITLVTECGIIGLYLYMMWLIWIWRETSRATTWAKKAKRQARPAFVPSDVKPLLVAMVVSLFAGEIVYPYRPCFSFMGVFLFLVAVLNHRALVSGVTFAANGRRKREKTGVRSDLARRYEDGVPRRVGTGAFAKV
jgi:O-antigen ligase